MSRIEKADCAFWCAGVCNACTDKCRYSTKDHIMIPERMTHFHGADRDTGGSTVFHKISEEYVEWLEKLLEAFIQQAGNNPHSSNAFASKAFEQLQAWYVSRNPIK